MHRDQIIARIAAWCQVCADENAIFALEPHVCLGRAQRGTQVDAVALPQTKHQSSATGNANTVAFGAEAVAHRRNEGQPAAGFLNAPVACRTAGMVIDWRQLPALHQVLAHHIEWQVVIGGKSERHHFDQRQVAVMIAAPADHLVELGIVDAGHGHHVDAHRNSSRARGVDAGQHIGQTFTARDALEDVFVQSVQRNVNATHTSGVQGHRLASQQGAVARQSQFVEFTAANPGTETFDQPHDAGAHQRLAARQAQLPDAQADEGRRQTLHFLKRKYLALW